MKEREREWERERWGVVRQLTEGQNSQLQLCIGPALTRCLAQVLERLVHILKYTTYAGRQARAHTHTHTHTLTHAIEADKAKKYIIRCLQHKTKSLLKSQLTSVLMNYTTSAVYPKEGEETGSSQTRKEKRSKILQYYLELPRPALFVFTVLDSPFQQLAHSGRTCPSHKAQVDCSETTNKIQRQVFVTTMYQRAFYKGAHV